MRTPFIASAIAAALLCAAGCDGPEPARDRGEAVSAEMGMDGIRPEIQAELAAKAENGDWEAARELANYRLYVLRAYDATTLKLVRQWAEHWPGGRYAEAKMLFRSCDLAQRREAIAKFETLTGDPWFTAHPARRQLLDEIAAMKSNVEQTPSPCATY